MLRRTGLSKLTLRCNSDHGNLPTGNLDGCPILSEGVVERGALTPSSTSGEEWEFAVGGWSEVEKTWDNGELTEHDVIEAADHTGYTSPSDYVRGDDPHDPDDPTATD